MLTSAKRKSRSNLELNNKDNMQHDRQRQRHTWSAVFAVVCIWLLLSYEEKFRDHVFVLLFNENDKGEQFVNDSVVLAY